MFGAWLLICGLALGGAAGTSAEDRQGSEPREQAQTAPSLGASAKHGASAKPDSGIKASPTLRPQKAVNPVKPAGRQARTVKANRSGKSGEGSPGKMQVAEPKAGGALAADGGSRAWRLSHSQGLTEEQKRAFRERKDQMQEMMALIKEKRLAMRDAEPGKRAVLARELHNLILEEGDYGNEASAAARSAPEPRESGAAEKSATGNQRRKQAEFRQSQLERRKEEMRKEEIRREEIRKQQIERLRKIQEFKSGSEWEYRNRD